METVRARVNETFEFWLMVECPRCGENVNCLMADEIKEIDTGGDLYACIEMVAMMLTPECPMLFHQCEECKEDFVIDFTDVMKYIQSPKYQETWKPEMGIFDVTLPRQMTL